SKPRREAGEGSRNEGGSASCVFRPSTSSTSTRAAIAFNWREQLYAAVLWRTLMRYESTSQQGIHRRLGSSCDYISTTLLTTYRVRVIRFASSLIEGRLLETILKAGRGVASCGGGS